MKLHMILSVVILFVCVVELHAWWGSRSSSSSSSSGSTRRGWFRSRSSSGGSRKGHSYDYNRRKLTNLYNSKVTKVESYSRPLNSWLGNLGVKHTGVVATTQNGDRWLIHKGKGYGKSSSTVVTNANHMSNKWEKTGSKYTSGNTISDLMKAGYVNKPYGFGPGKKICWGASRNIMDKAGRKKRGC